MSETRNWVKIKEFNVTDSVGRQYVVVRYDKHIDTILLSGEFNPSVGRRRLCLTDGTPVRAIDEETFQVCETGVFLKKIQV